MILYTSVTRIAYCYLIVITFQLLWYQPLFLVNNGDRKLAIPLIRDCNIGRRDCLMCTLEAQGLRIVHIRRITSVMLQVHVSLEAL